MEITYEIVEVKDGLSRMAKIHFKSKDIDETGIFRAYVHKPYIGYNVKEWNRQGWLTMCKKFGEAWQNVFNTMYNKLSPIFLLGFMTAKKSRSKQWLLISMIYNTYSLGQLSIDLCFQTCNTKQCQNDSYNAYQSVWYNAATLFDDAKYYTVTTTDEAKYIGQVFIDLADDISKKEQN